MRILFRAALLTATTLCPAVALAQAAPPAAADEAGNPDIVVTARKTAERLQDVPVAITAFDAAEIKSARITNLADVAKLTPGLIYTPLFGRQNQLPIIRGAAQTFGQLNVGVFLDGIYLAGKGGVDLELNDLERVEVVKGPQSALYGRNTFAGAINYVTQRPTATLTGRMEATVGDHGLYKGQASISGPLSDTLRFRAGGFYKHFDGFYKSAIDGGKVDFEESYGGLGTLEWKPDDQFTATLRFSYSKDDSGQPASSVIRTNAGFGTPSGGSATQQRNLLYIGQLPVIPVNGVTVNTGSFPGLPGGKYGDREESIRGSAVLEYDFGTVTGTSITSYAKRNAEYTYDGDNTICSVAAGCPNFGFPFAPAIPVNSSAIALSSNKGYLRDVSQELRFASNKGGKIDWLFGLFYYDNIAYGVDRGLSPTATSGATAYSAFNPNYSYPATRLTTKSYSVFGSTTWHATEQFSITGELRYEYEKQTFAQQPLYVTSAARSTLVFAVPTAAQTLALAQYDAAVAAGAQISPVAITATTAVHRGIYDLPDAAIAGGAYATLFRDQSGFPLRHAARDPELQDHARRDGLCQLCAWCEDRWVQYRPQRVRRSAHVPAREQQQLRNRLQVRSGRPQIAAERRGLLHRLEQSAGGVPEPDLGRRLLDQPHLYLQRRGLDQSTASRRRP